MAKRSDYAINQPTKKAKVDDFNDLWDDDFDGDVIEDCFKRATQICQEENNATLTSYSVFKQPTGIICSTQISQPQNLEEKLKQLQEKYAEKEGEVTILRANLQNLRTTCQTEQERREKEWKDKLKSTQKESRSVKSELEFKNLEIANLKQQISELSRHINNDLNASQRPKAAECKINSPQKPVSNEINKCTKIEVNSKIYYPLKHFNFSTIFKPSSEENFVIKTKYNSYRLQNHTQTVNFKKTPISINEKELDLDYVYSEIAFLINQSCEDLKSEKSGPALNKIICVSQQLLTDFHDYLKQIEENIQLQDVQESDSKYLQENESFDDLNEVGVKCGKLLAFLAEIIPFSSYLKNFLLQDQPLNLNNNVDYVKLLPCFKNKSKLEYAYLTLIYNIILTMGRTRKEQLCSEFLEAVVTLLCRIFTYGETTIQNSQLIYDVVKEVLFLRPQHKVIYRITFLMKSASNDSNFLNCLCSKPNETKTKNTAKGILYFNRESCRFHMFVILLENTLLKINNKNEIFSISLNMLNFIYNVFKINNLWLYQLEYKRCNCLCQLYKLGIGIIYKNLKSYHEEIPSNDVDKNNYKTIFKNAVKILHLLTSHSCDFIQKYVTDLARFKEIIYSLIQLSGEMDLNIEELRNLDKLSVVEDLPEISSVKFAEIDF